MIQICKKSDPTFRMPLENNTNYVVIRFIFEPLYGASILT